MNTQIDQIACRAIAENSYCCIFYLDREFRYRYVSRKIAEWYHIDPEGVLGKTFEAVVGSQIWSVLGPYLERAVAGEEITLDLNAWEPPLETLTPRNPPDIIRSVFLPHRDERDDVQGVLAFVVDVTSERRERDRLQEQFVQAQKMEAVGRLTGGIAHDFNNTLGILIGHLDLMRATIPDESALLKSFDAALEAAMHGSELIKHLLAFSRQQTLQPGLLKTDTILEGMKNLLDRTLGERIEFRLFANPELGAVLVDRVQFEAAIVNLCVNSRDAMPNGGILTIETRNIQVGKEDAAGYSVAPGDYVLISVADTGEGMTPEVKARAFDPIFSTKPIDKGSGLGLSMVF
ncbi:MAG: PAS domain-containing protein, partial [Verrucomicrobia bacterium]|nr:PAS domain-containing protein [Verrucomicrobiota bacterium]